MLLLMEAQDGEWDALDAMVRAFQQTVLSLRDAQVPVVLAVNGLTLGGACEMSLLASGVQAAAETYMGLVEVGVGLIPAGCGTKEMLRRALQRRPTPQADALPFVQQAFETIGFGTVSTSAPCSSSGSARMRMRVGSPAARSTSTVCLAESAIAI